MLPVIQKKLLELRHDEEGLTVVEIILIIAVIVLPLVLVLILFGKDIKNFIKNMWQTTNKEAANLSTSATSGSTPGN